MVGSIGGVNLKTRENDSVFDGVDERIVRCRFTGLGRLRGGARGRSVGSKRGGKAAKNKRLTRAKLVRQWWVRVVHVEEHESRCEVEGGQSSRRHQFLLSYTGDNVLLWICKQYLSFFDYRQTMSPMRILPYCRCAFEGSTLASYTRGVHRTRTVRVLVLYLWVGARCSRKKVDMHSSRDWLLDPKGSQSSARQDETMVQHL